MRCAKEKRIVGGSLSTAQSPNASSCLRVTLYRKPAHNVSALALTAKEKLVSLPIAIHVAFHYLFKINFFHFLFHNSHDKFDRQITVSNQINEIES